jgi:hypothetical protein
VTFLRTKKKTQLEQMGRVKVELSGRHTTWLSMFPLCVSVKYFQYKVKGAGSGAQWESSCLVCARAWVIEPRKKPLNLPPMCDIFK